MSSVTMLVLDTSHGPAHAHLDDVADARGTLVLGHGAGGGVGARDLVETRDVAVSLGIAVALIEQPYRVAGRRSPPPAWQLDVVWMEVVEMRVCGAVRGVENEHRHAGHGRTSKGVVPPSVIQLPIDLWAATAERGRPRAPATV